METQKVTLVDLVLSLRERLVDALNRNDRETLRQLHQTFDTLTEVSYAWRDKTLSALLEDFAYSAQHGAMGVFGKAMDVPSIERVVVGLRQHMEQDK
jgi:hypothetical protein